MNGPLGNELNERISASRIDPAARGLVLPGVALSGLSSEEHLYLFRRCVEGVRVVRQQNRKCVWITQLNHARDGFADN